MKNNKKEKTEIIFKKWISLVDPKIKEILNLSVDKKTQKLVNYQITMGGKRFRPVLAIASCLACGGKIKDVLYPAAGLEIFHNCTLIYDDIIDKGKLRRGSLTTCSKFGQSIAQCIGLDYTAAIFQAANKSKYPFQVSEIFARTMKKAVEGEILDILFEQSGRENEKYVVNNRYNKITERDYLEMVSKKTASLIQACCEVGAVSAAASKSETNALKKYGLNLGIVFQIRDDILDIFGDEKEFGKKIGKDIQERKLGNIVVFYALKELTNKERKKFSAIFKKSEIKNKDIKEVLRLINKTGAKEKSFLLGEKYIKEARRSLKDLPQNKWNKFLAEIADFVIERKK